MIKQGPAFEVLATNTLDDGFDASPALVDNELYLRGAKFLYSIGRSDFARAYGPGTRLIG